MLKVENFVTPSPQQWEIVIHGSRNAFKSWSKSDSGLCDPNEHYNENCEKRCTFMWTGECDDPWITSGFILGQNDENLFKSLCKFGSSDRKLLRQLPIILDVNAPLYWWKQADKYQIGTVTNSESTMHTITKYPFKLEDFSVDHLNLVDSEKNNWFKCYENGSEFDGLIIDDVWIDLDEYFEYYYLGLLDSLRERYLETKDKNLWYLLNELLPQSYNQKRTWSLNYEVALNMTMQRYDHPLSEWHTLIQYFINELPYFDLILQAVGLTEELKQHGYEL